MDEAHATYDKGPALSQTCGLSGPLSNLSLPFCPWTLISYSLITPDALPRSNFWLHLRRILDFYSCVPQLGIGIPYCSFCLWLTVDLSAFLENILRFCLHGSSTLCPCFGSVPTPSASGWHGALKTTNQRDTKI